MSNMSPRFYGETRKVDKRVDVRSHGSRFPTMWCGEQCSLFSRSPDCKMPVDDVSCEKKVGDTVWSMHLILTHKVSIANIRDNEAVRRNHLSIREGVV